ARQLRAQASQQQYDVQAWEALVDDVKAMPGISDDLRAAFEEIVAVMPSASSVWARYVELELREAPGLETAKQIFGRCLLACPSLDLHQQYLRFVKRSNEPRGPQGLPEVRSAYEFSLDTLGQDLAAGTLWQEYISFLLSSKPGSEAFKALYAGAMEGQEEAARTPMVRRAYQRAVVVPSLQLEALWRAYESWEMRTDKQLGKKVLEEWRPRFQAARAAVRERRSRLDALHLNALPFPPGKGGQPQQLQSKAWSNYLAYEKSNPQKLEPDSPLLVTRVTLAYSQCLTVMWFHPEVWYDYAMTQLDLAPERALAVLARGQRALPACTLLKFTHAEILELQGLKDGAKQVFETMALQLEAEVPQKAGEGADEGLKQEVPLPAPTPSPYGGEQGALIWVHYMSLLRRLGEVPQARQLFLRARRWQLTSPATRSPSSSAPTATGSLKQTVAQQQTSTSGWQLYAAMAHMEWVACGRASITVPCKVFELGLEDVVLAKDPEYVLAYQALLQDAGDTDNARALFERALAEPECAASAALWRAYVVFEWQAGNPGAAAEVYQRMRGALGYQPMSDTMNSSSGATADTNLSAFTALAQNSLAIALAKFGFANTVPCAAEGARQLRRAAGLEQGVATAEVEDLVDRHAARDKPDRDGYRPDSRPASGARDADREGREREGRERDRGYERGERQQSRRHSRSRSRERDGGNAPSRDYNRGTGAGTGPPRREREREVEVPVAAANSGLPDLIELLLRDLPPPMVHTQAIAIPSQPALEGPGVPPEVVMDVIMYSDLSATTVAYACMELDQGRLPSGAHGVPLPKLMAHGRSMDPSEMVQHSVAFGHHLMGPPGAMHSMHAGGHPQAMLADQGYGPAQGYGQDPGFMAAQAASNGPMTRKRRWESQEEVARYGGPGPQGVAASSYMEEAYGQVASQGWR
ncbi:hypothetical protein QJQ45_018615, partial [Haematococcus lacustris]